MNEEKQLKLLNEVNRKVQGVAYQHEVNERKTSIMNLNAEQLCILDWAVSVYAKSLGFKFDSEDASYYVEGKQ